MLKRVMVMVLVILSLSLQGCIPVATSGLKSYIDSIDGYQFLYPNGWLEVKVTNGADVVFHDIIQQTEGVSVVVSSVPDSKKTLRDLGTPKDVGYQLGKTAIAPPNSGRKAELISAESREMGDKTYYLLEYAVKIGDQIRHNLASAAISRGKLYTFNAATAEERWPKMEEVLRQVVNSFSVY
jgi:photosystem II oxygen-evolving enhancer protein 2